MASVPIQVTRYIERARDNRIQPKFLWLRGPVGCGKTLVVSSECARCQVQRVDIGVDELTDVGDRKVFKDDVETTVARLERYAFELTCARTTPPTKVAIFDDADGTFDNEIFGQPTWQRRALDCFLMFARTTACACIVISSNDLGASSFLMTLDKKKDLFESVSMFAPSLNTLKALAISVSSRQTRGKRPMAPLTSAQIEEMAIAAQGDARRLKNDILIRHSDPEKHRSLNCFEATNVLLGIVPTTNDVETAAACSGVDRRLHAHYLTAARTVDAAVATATALSEWDVITAHMFNKEYATRALLDASYCLRTANAKELGARTRRTPFISYAGPIDGDLHDKSVKWRQDMAVAVREAELVARGVPTIDTIPRGLPKRLSEQEAETVHYVSTLRSLHLKRKKPTTDANRLDDVRAQSTPAVTLGKRMADQLKPV